MRYHHTKDKGDLGAIQAMADMTAKGWKIAVPLSEHEAFDFLAYEGDRCLRVQVKYRAAVRGVVHFPLATCWADRHGVHTVPIDRSSIDLVCIYCPDTATCYYVDPQQWQGGSVRLRITDPKNSQVKGISWARDFTEIPSTVRGLSFGYASALVDVGGVRHSREPRATWLLRAHSSAG